jgi:hypothetical protein
VAGFRNSGLGLVFSALLAMPSFAADDGLYGAPPPPDSAYVRIVNITDAALTAVKAGEVSFDAAASMASGYKIIHGGKVALDAGMLHLSPEFLPQHSYSAIIGTDQITIIEDKLQFSKAKANLVFYNLDLKDPVSLATADLKLAIFKDVPAGTEVAREVNPLSIAFASQKNGALLAQSEKATLERGGVYSIFAFTTPTGAKTITAKNRLDK